MWKNDLKKYQNQLGLIFENRNPSHEPETNPIKDKPEKKHSRSQIPNLSNIKGRNWREKKIQLKKETKKQIAIKRMMTKFDIQINFYHMLKD
jgi:hypothetical protein